MSLSKANKERKEYIHFSIEPDFKREVEKLASENKLKVASYIKWLLNKEIQNKEIQETKNKKSE